MQPCRQACRFILGGVLRVRRDLKKLKEKQTRKRVNEVQSFVAGMVLVGGLAGCNEPVMNQLFKADAALDKIE